MGKTNSEHSLPGFARVAPSIYIQDSQVSFGDQQTGLGPSPSFAPSLSSLPSRPARELSARSSQTSPPDLIIITSWTGAAIKHVAKYTASYNVLYPGVPILVITTVVTDLVVRSTKQKLKTLAPAVDYLLSAPAPPPAPHAHSHHGIPYFQQQQQQQHYQPPSTLRFASILLHAFSEGGLHKAVCLARAYLAATRQGARLPVEAFVLDSTPGTADFGRAATAFRRSLPRQSSRAARALGRPLAAGVGDELVWWPDVHAHALDSSRTAGAAAAPRPEGLEGDDQEDSPDGGPPPGVGSLMVRFKRTAHCAHARGEVNGRVYWAAVRKTWEAREDGGLGLGLGLSRRLSLDSLCDWGEDADERDRGNWL
ncbi:hypothetical protein MMYC01_205397 [Madurella mycetomatis]|uniref:Uncharacterized protein n=1 Tax=Madurella mycetomatis TaxID=100816 RepID=A0A175W293_9PEZI|nr:hypothetical protein MMYC01_205397 [Madurella mycetomatis]